MIELLILILVGTNVYPLAFPQPVAGTYQTVAQADGSLLITDTRTGAISHCVLKDKEIACVAVVVK